MKVYLCSLLFLVALVGAKKNYDGFEVFRVIPDNLPQLRALKNLQDIYDGLSEVQFWNSALDVNRPVNIQVAPTAVLLIKKQLKKHGLSFQVVIHDVQKLIDNQMASMAERRKSSNGTFQLDVYNNFNEIDAYLEQLSSENEGTEWKTLGDSLEGRPIFLFSIASGDKPAIAIECNIHAREWITGAVCINLITNLVTVEKDLRDAYDWYIIPIANPDGFAYSWSDDRMWRKNRKGKGEGLCNGVDLSRNFDANFGGEGSGKYECDDDYHGESAFSEKETQAERDLILSLKDRLLAYWTLHSYGNLYLVPYCYTFDHPGKFGELLTIANTSGEAIKNTHGTVFTAGGCAFTLYDYVSGGALDWVYNTTSPKFAAAMLLRDEGAYGFLLPEDQIIPVYEEVWNGLKAALEAMK